MYKDIKPDTRMKVKNRRGQWIPAIEEPYYLFWGRCKCACGKILRNRESYQGHYALKHILAL